MMISGHDSNAFPNDQQAEALRPIMSDPMDEIADALACHEDEIDRLTAELNETNRVVAALSRRLDRLATRE